MAREPVSGCSDEAMTVPGTDVREVISGADFDGEAKVFWLRSIWVGNEHASETATVEVYDSDETDSVVAATQCMVLMCGPKSTTVFDFPAPGIAFRTNITAATTLGTIGAYGIGAMGYKE